MEGTAFVIRDRGSRYGASVNGDQVKEHTLAHGDRIRLGRSGGAEMVFLLTESTRPTEQTTFAVVSDLRQVAALLEGLRALGSGRVLDEVLGLVMDSAIAVSGAERGFIMLCDESGELEFKVGRARGRVTLPGSRFETSRNIPVEVFRTGRSRMEADLLESPLPLFAWHVVARSFAHVDLPRPRDLLLGI